MSNAQPGWYPDPNARGRMRWWDGVRWHHATRTEAELAPAPAPAETGAPRSGPPSPDATTQAIPLAPVLPALMDAARELGADGPLGAAGEPPGGGPGPDGTDGPGGRRRRKAWWWGAGAAGVVVIVCAAVALPGHDGDPAATPTPTASFVTLDPAAREAATPSTTTTPSPAATRPTPTPSATATPTTTPSPAPTRTARPSPTTRPSAPSTTAPGRPVSSPTRAPRPPTPTPTPTSSPTSAPVKVAPSGTYDCPSGAPIKARNGTAYPPDWWTYGVIRPDVCFASIDDAEADGYEPAGT